MVQEIEDVFDCEILDKEHFHHYRPVNFLKNYYIEETIENDHNSATLVHF